MARNFLTAEWRNLAMANYAVEPSVLKPYLPHKTELDTWNDTHYLSLVGFRFINTRLRGFTIPFHSHFEEVNLRFYVRYKTPGNQWRRGVVFIREIVPRQALSAVARLFYNEPYETMPMQHEWNHTGQLSVSYKWKKKRWHSLNILADKQAIALVPGSETAFITEHYWGYTRYSDSSTSEYEVEHPVWDIHPVNSYNIDVDFGLVYGRNFEFLNRQNPVSVCLAAGSEIVVKKGIII